ncbi:hypothetical protein GALMADRAFT_214722 [Galerina marginata CBS 339.88]|uniref:Uncharacterized protein n=1 Tax=Galerina marginata (strain CBS 339.88) TaxID=685588 RepID=A0A067SQF6_GALM3|nr:hypothetical protein GALMADRAFT_214722 [Galerina marginata CBS 339.88]
MTPDPFASPSLFSENNTCGICGLPIPIKLAGPKGRLAGKFYLHCFNKDVHPENMPNWWKIFEPLAAGVPTPPHLQRLIARTPTSSPEISSRAVFSTPIELFEPQELDGKPKCGYGNCTRKRIHRLCPRQMCRPHCIFSEGCPFHSEKQLSGTQLRKLEKKRVPAPLSAQTVEPRLERSLSPASWQYLNIISDGGPGKPFPGYVGDPPVPRIGSEGTYLQLPADGLLKFSDQTWNSPPPSLALLSTAAPPSQIFRLDPGPLVPTASSSHTLVPLTQKAGTVSRQPRRTSQMNRTWMEELRETTPSDTLGDSSAQNKVVMTPRKAKDLTLNRRFNLVYWDNSIDSANLQIVAECPNWPQWSLDKFSGLPFLGSNIKEIQLYSTEYRVWMMIPMSYVHPLTTNCAIMLRRQGVAGVDEQKHIDLFFPALPRRFRTNQTQEHSVIRSQLKARKAKARPPPSDSDSDVEVVDTLSPPPPKCPRIKEELVTPARLRPHLNVSIPLTPTFIDLTESPNLSMSPSPFTFSLSHSSESPIPSTSGFSSHNAARWPRNWYAVDVVAGFKQIDNLVKQDTQCKVPGSLAHHLSAVFGCEVPVSTYRDARSRWEKASQALRDAVLEGGRTPSGLWTYLASRVPLKG